ncbi:hypothetical protein J2S43_007862 [Catenuloplanes nepalensis]|uniref:Uncharacterized protein n=1 Tax=Catenuloplanes nepalensis TaxID=587533 RepID=A0ABT9N718_9ACTN|nr:hypothetical protein [Catenuloplanes nepalensis]MDP9799350.1 hypothetical protein [Catenuloplanes nepalensis]
MIQVKITAPTPFSGKVASVGFVDGVAMVDPAEHRAALAYFRRRGGYVIDENTPDTPARTPERPAPPKKTASTEMWRAWAVEHGGMPQEAADTMSRDQLADHFENVAKTADQS